ncbi:AGE family epimerase/isomerase [Hyphococcus luteus]|uniref:AGE family epimerase/isomerase n=1 Tax=Hyphococcus luteus TaxID=2058213 RepID=UPI0013FE2297|nr:AGE family epimerase/isomerase [Marinicaulis flavus]
MARLRDWFVQDALPLWAAEGYDEAGGGFYEALHFDGRPFTGRPRRVRTQARQIHTFSQASLRGWRNGAEALAAEGFEHFLSRACPDHGARGCVHRLDDEGAVIDDRRDLYDQAFLLLACASRWEAAQDERALKLADKTIAFLDSELAAPQGGWRESDQGELPRRQNPHMHLFEAFLALYRVTGREEFLARAGQIRELFARVFYGAEKGVIREFFDEDWRLQDKDQPVEPGHMLEWVWLLRAYDRAHDRTHDRTAGADSGSVREKLYARALALGADPGFFGFFDNKSPLTGGVHGAKRLWPQTEGFRAALVLGRRQEAAALADNLFMTYLAVETPGLWVDEFDAEGRPVAKDTPASILYHLYEAVAEADAVLSMGEAG